VLQIILEDYCLSLGLSLPFFVELVEVLGVLQDFIEELTMASFLACLLATAHRLLKPVKGSCLLLRLSIALGSTVELSVNQLSLVHDVSQCLGAILI
jgi:hypothetical protein